MTARVLTSLILATLLVFGLAGMAAATEGDSSYTTWSGPGSPHGGYDVGTKKCSVCHAVHRAGAAGDGVGSEVLLRSTVADACSYCHITPGVSTKIVYGGQTANYSGADFNNAHNAFGAPSVQCITCHQVHAAQDLMTDNASLTASILTTAEAGYDEDSDPANVGQPLASDSFDVALTKWCTRCHLYVPGFFTDSHVLTTASASFAFANSNYCHSCHASNTLGGVVTTGSAFPHYTDGARFLISSITSAGAGVGTKTVDPQYDGVCLRCHRSGTGSGIGLTF